MSQEVRELVVLVGMQGAGKTYYCETVLADYERISQDEGPRSYSGILLLLQDLLRRGVPRIVIDRTNPMRYQRADFGRPRPGSRVSRKDRVSGCGGRNLQRKDPQPE